MPPTETEEGDTEEEFLDNVDEVENRCSDTKFFNKPNTSRLSGELDQLSKLYLNPISNQIKAVDFADKAHEGQFRKSGEPFLIHPINVGLILASLKMDADTIIAGLLHDVVEDCEFL